MEERQRKPCCRRSLTAAGNDPAEPFACGAAEEELLDALEKHGCAPKRIRFIRMPIAWKDATAWHVCRALRKAGLRCRMWEACWPWNARSLEPLKREQRTYLSWMCARLREENLPWPVAYFRKAAAGGQ
mgnify:CR=1 FL=1